jgi:hypothetical protein
VRPRAMKRLKQRDEFAASAHQERRFSRPLNFSLDSRNENLPEKRIHRNYALTTVPISPRSRVGTKSPFMPAAATGVAAMLALRRRRVNGARR